MPGWTHTSRKSFRGRAQDDSGQAGASACRWSKLLLACWVCNGSEYKGNRFPLKAEGGPFVNPCAEEPKQHVSFEYDPVTRLASVRAKTQRGQTTEKFLGLNRKDLRAYRSTRLTYLWFIAQRAATDLEARQLLDEAAATSQPYSAFAAMLRETVLGSS